MTEEVIRFTAQVAKFQTLADGGSWVILDLPEGAINKSLVKTEPSRWRGQIVKRRDTVREYTIP